MTDKQTILKLRQAQKSRVRKLGIFLFIVQVGIMFGYGFGSKFNTTTTANSLGYYPDNSDQLIKQIGPAILAIIGWGLIIAYSQNSALSSLTITLIVVGLTVQLQPLLNAFWAYCTVGGWGPFSLNLINMSTAMFACISLLVVFCFLSGRVSIIETFILIIVFNIGWALNVNLITYLLVTKFIGEIQVSDGNGTNYIYIFACVFALIVSILLNTKPGVNPSQTGPRYAVYIALIGTGFTFAAFPFSGQIYATPSGAYERSMNIYFALSASVLFTYWSSALYAGFKVGVRESLVGVLGGGVMISIVAPYINNIGGCITVGAFAGVVSGLWLRHGYPRMNENRPYDPMGLTGPVLINGFFGSAFVAPILFGVYKNNSLIPGELTLASTLRTSTYYLAIFGITLAVALGMGLIAGLICSGTRNTLDDFLFRKLISQDSGLYNQSADRNPQQHGAPVSMHALRDQNL